MNKPINEAFISEKGEGGNIEATATVDDPLNKYWKFPTLDSDIDSDDNYRQIEPDDYVMELQSTIAVQKFCIVLLVFLLVIDLGSLIWLNNASIDAEHEIKIEEDHRALHDED